MKPEQITTIVTNQSKVLWGFLARPIYLFIAAALLLFMMLGGRELWTQEHRWADIVSGMFFRHDFFHPYLGSNDYYDKPLLSYWLIAAVSVITRQLNTWVLRLPSALAGLLAIWSIYRLGYRLRDKQFGLFCGWLLTTTFYFIFWARVSSADMLNIAGSLFAVAWYFEKREETNWLSYSVFFLILALTSLCKGLIGAVVPVLAILPDMIYQHRWKKHLNFRILLGLIPALIVYILPFIVSASINNDSYAQNGLYLVYRENFLRYFQPFDHKDPIYTYFIYLPIYLLPWTIFFIPALWNLKARWLQMNWNSKWIVWSLFVLFMFFTASGSRRSYYVLPMAPFAILLTADWLYALAQEKNTILRYVRRMVFVFFFILFSFFGILQPLFYAQGGHRYFAKQLHEEQRSLAGQLKPGESWQYVLLDPESKISFYLHLAPEVKFLGMPGIREQQTLSGMVQAWPIVTEKPKNVIFVSRKLYKPMLQHLLPHYRMVEAQKTLGARLFHLDDTDGAIAFIPPA